MMMITKEEEGKKSIIRKLIFKILKIKNKYLDIL
jgi:hypothetical protein